MTKIRHQLLNYQISPKTETLIIGTFNPDAEKNTANFFYGRPHNFLWTLIPAAFGEASLKNKSKAEKLVFIEKYTIDFIDLISEVDVDEVTNYDDIYLDNKVTEWRDVIAEMENLPNLKKVGLTRKSFGSIPNLKRRIDNIKTYCEQHGIQFQFLKTPSRLCNQAKQQEWTDFFTDRN